MPNESRKFIFSYSLPMVLGNLAVTLFTGFFTLTFSALAMWTLSQALIQFIVNHDIRVLFVGLVIWLFPVAFAYFFLLFSNSYPQIELSDEGISVKVFHLWWIFVSWKDIEDIRRVRVSRSRSRLVIVRQLTPIHKLIGWQWGGILKPAFVIRGALEGYDRIVKTIEERMGGEVRLVE